MTSDNNYVGISHREILALAGLSGECFRLYVVVASFAYGRKTVCHPKWSQISERMGKDCDPGNGRRWAKQLEDAGLLKRGEFGQRDRWRLVLKEQMIKERACEINTVGVSNAHSETCEINTVSVSNVHGVNKNNKEEKKHFHSIGKKEDEFQEKSPDDWENEGYILLSEGWVSMIGIINKLVQNRTNIFRWNAKDRSKIIERLRDDGVGEDWIQELNEVINTWRRR